MPKYTTEQLKATALRNLFSESRFPLDNLENYGSLEDIAANSGRRILVSYGARNAEYLVPSEAAWTAGVGAIKIDKAYRIFSSKKEKLQVREVKNPSELENVAAGYMLEIEKTLAKIKGNSSA